MMCVCIARALIILFHGVKAKALFDAAAKIMGYDLLDVCVNGPEQRLNQTLVSQPALYVTSLAALAKVRRIAR